jgi:hypothetical protein
MSYSEPDFGGKTTVPGSPDAGDAMAPDGILDQLGDAAEHVANGIGWLIGILLGGGS